MSVNAGKLKLQPALERFGTEARTFSFSRPKTLERRDMRRAAARREHSRALDSILGAARAPYPGFIDPCLATPRSGVPNRGEWIHEIKYDGYRAQAHLTGRKSVIYTRRGFDWSDTFASVRDALSDLRARQLILDGEVVVPDERGISPDACTIAHPFPVRRTRAAAKWNSRSAAEFPESTLRGAKDHERRQKPARRPRQQTH